MRGGGKDGREEERTSAGRSGPTPPTSRRPIPRRGCFAKGMGREAKLCYMGHVLMDNRHGQVVDARLTRAYSGAEREVAEQMIRAARQRRRGRLTLGGDKGYDTRAFVAGLRALGATPHVAQHHSARFTSAIDGRTTRHPGYGLSQVKRKLVEQGVRPGEDRGRAAQDASPRPAPSELDGRLLPGSLRPGAHPESHVGGRLMQKRLGPARRDSGPRQTHQGAANSGQEIALSPVRPAMPIPESVPRVLSSAAG